jgi:hypothetical protein
MEGYVNVIDYEKQKIIFETDESRGRVCALSFYENTLLVGSRDTRILLYDV